MLLSAEDSPPFGTSSRENLSTIPTGHPFTKSELVCSQTCPEVFDMDGDIAVVKGDSVPGGAEETCRQAAEECPVECIAIED